MGLSEDFLLKKLNAPAGNEVAESAETEPNSKCALKPKLFVRKG